MQEEQFFQIILILDQWFRRRCHLNNISYLGSGGPCAGWSRTIYAILIEGIIRNLHVR